MKYIGYIVCLLLTIGETPLFAQSSYPDTSKSKLVAYFGGLTQGEIAIEDHLSDSLYIRLMAEQFHTIVTSFNLTYKCNDRVLSSMRNERGNKLTPEMIAVIKKLHPGCHLVFDNIDVMIVGTDKNGLPQRGTHFPGKFRLELVLK